MHPHPFISTPSLTNYIVWCSDGTIGRDIIGKVSYCCPSPIEYKSYAELYESPGVRKIIDGGINDFGFKTRVIIAKDGSVWDYIPEDSLYEKRNKPQ